MTAVHQFSQLIEQFQQYLRWQKEHGCRGLESDDATRRILAVWRNPQKSLRISTVTPILAPDAGPAAPHHRETLEEIRLDLGPCQRCRLHAGRSHIVFGAGPASARLMFVGEAPGFHEDRQGEPFVGQAGQLLTKIISAMGLTREQVYIGNIIKCRPPKNRDPRPDEIAACAPFLQRQIQVIEPEIICALGSFAARTLLKSNHPISRLRGRFHDYHGIRVMPTFHPSYLLHNPDQKRPVWEDIQKIMAAVGINR